MNDTLKELSNRYQKYLLTGICSEKNFKIESQIIYRLIVLNYDDAEIETFFKKYACKETYFKQNKINNFRNLVSKSRIHFNNYGSQFDIECNQIINYANYFTNLTVHERIILKTILKISKLSGSFENLFLSIRRISKLSNTGTNTVKRNLKRLCDKKIIIKITEASYRTPAVYSLNSQPLLKSINLNTSKNKNYRKNDTYNKKIYSRDDFNKTGFLILDFLYNNPNKKFDTKSISNTLNISFPTVKKKLDLMKKMKFVNSEKIKTSTKLKEVYQIKESFNMEKFK